MLLQLPYSLAFFLTLLAGNNWFFSTVNRMSSTKSYDPNKVAYKLPKCRLYKKKLFSENACLYVVQLSSQQRKCLFAVTIHPLEIIGELILKSKKTLSRSNNCKTPVCTTEAKKHIFKDTKEVLS